MQTRLTKRTVSRQQTCSRHPQVPAQCKTKTLRQRPSLGSTCWAGVEAPSRMVQCCGCRLSVKPLVAAFRPTQWQNDLTRPFLILSASHPTLTGATADWPSPPLGGDRLRQSFWPALPAAQDWSPVCGQDTGHLSSIWGLAQSPARSRTAGRRVTEAHASMQTSQVPTLSNPGPSEDTWRGPLSTGGHLPLVSTPGSLLRQNHIPIVYVTLGP